MRYVLSDVHGEYDLFVKLLEKLKFSSEDEMYICGDMIDKGEDSIRLIKYISSFPNIHCVIGNHEFAFLGMYHSIMEVITENFDIVLTQLRTYYPKDGYMLDWDLIDWIEALPSYIEEKDFICVHAGVPIDENGKLVPLKDADIKELVYDRRFKNTNIVHKSPKCVFFGHTPTESICGENKIIKYKREGIDVPKSIRDYYKVHLDMGAWKSGVLSCLCIDTLEEIYVHK